MVAVLDLLRGASVILVALVSVIGAVAGSVVAPPAVRTGYVGYVFAAMPPVFAASAVLPVVVLRGGDGLAAAAIVLGAYAAIVVAFTILGAGLGWAQGLVWVAVAFASFAGDRAAHAAADRAMSRGSRRFEG